MLVEGNTGETGRKRENTLDLNFENVNVPDQNQINQSNK